MSRGKGYGGRQRERIYLSYISHSKIRARLLIIRCFDRCDVAHYTKGRNGPIGLRAGQQSAGAGRPGARSARADRRAPGRRHPPRPESCARLRCAPRSMSMMGSWLARRVCAQIWYWFSLLEPTSNSGSRYGLPDRGSGRRVFASTGSTSEPTRFADPALFGVWRTYHRCHRHLRSVIAKCMICN
jgi:hypothetical protein